MERTEDLPELNAEEYRQNTLGELAQAKGIPVSRVYTQLQTELDEQTLKKIGYDHRRRGALSVISQIFGSQEWPYNQHLRFVELLNDGPKHLKGRNKNNPDYTQIARQLSSEFPSFPRTPGSVKTRAKELKRKK